MINNRYAYMRARSHLRRRCIIVSGRMGVQTHPRASHPKEARLTILPRGAQLGHFRSPMKGVLGLNNDIDHNTYEYVSLFLVFHYVLDICLMVLLVRRAGGWVGDTYMQHPSQLLQVVTKFVTLVQE